MLCTHLLRSKILRPPPRTVERPSFGQPPSLSIDDFKFFESRQRKDHLRVGVPGHASRTNSTSTMQNAA